MITSDGWLIGDDIRMSSVCTHSPHTFIPFMFTYMRCMTMEEKAELGIYTRRSLLLLCYLICMMNGNKTNNAMEWELKWKWKSQAGSDWIVCSLTLLDCFALFCILPLCLMVSSVVCYLIN